LTLFFYYVPNTQEHKEKRSHRNARR
jgi:hypothetical protein